MYGKLIKDLQQALGISDHQMQHILGMSNTEYLYTTQNLSSTITLDKYAERKLEMLLDVEQALQEMFVSDKQVRTWLKTKHRHLPLTPIEMLNDTLNTFLLKCYLCGVLDVDSDITTGIATV